MQIKDKYFLEVIHLICINDSVLHAQRAAKASNKNTTAIASIWSHSLQMQEKKMYGTFFANRKVLAKWWMEKSKKN